MKLYIKPVGTLGTNCYIVTDDQGACAVIDPGAQPDKLIAFLNEERLRPTQILLTHGHHDHIGGVRKLVETFGCRVGIGMNDAEQLSDTKKSLARVRGLDEEKYLVTADDLLKEGDTVTVGTLHFAVLDTPGHTRGGVTYRCEDSLFTGDTLFYEDIGRADLYGGNYQTELQSVKRLASLEGDLRVLPGHGPDSTLSHERKHNQYIKEVPNDDFY